VVSVLEEYRFGILLAGSRYQFSGEIADVVPEFVRSTGQVFTFD